MHSFLILSFWIVGIKGNCMLPLGKKPLFPHRSLWRMWDIFWVEDGELQVSHLSPYSQTSHKVVSIMTKSLNANNWAPSCVAKTLIIWSLWNSWYILASETCTAVAHETSIVTAVTQDDWLGFTISLVMQATNWRRYFFTMLYWLSALLYCYCLQNNCFPYGNVGCSTSHFHLKGFFVNSSWLS